MGFLKKDSPEDTIRNAPATQDVEKQVASHQENNGPAIESTSSTMMTIDPEVERRVLRKLDLRVPTLMGFFCKILRPERVIALYLTIRGNDRLTRLSGSK
jgi:hypothetical protein